MEDIKNNSTQKDSSNNKLESFVDLVKDFVIDEVSGAYNKLATTINQENIERK